MSTPPALNGRLVPLRTKDEVRASLETQTVYVIEVPAKHANVVKDAVQAALPEFKTSEISHLRRVVQFKYLPPHLQRQFHPPARLPRGEEDNPATAKILLSSSAALLPSEFCPPSASSADNGSPTADCEAVTKHFDLVRYFLLCPTRYMSHADLAALIRTCPPFEGRASQPRILYVTVPSLAPISAEQATEWSDQYWPISYKNTNPYGPHPSLVQRNQDEIQPEAGLRMALAKGVAEQISDLGLGEKIGVVIVDRSKSEPEVIAVAGDCRWRSLPEHPSPRLEPEMSWAMPCTEPSPWSQRSEPVPLAQPLRIQIAHSSATTPSPTSRRHTLKRKISPQAATYASTSTSTSPMSRASCVPWPFYTLGSGVASSVSGCPIPEE
ncbi:hypothetical protein P3342_009782 [Pyrenophora teres f. teres]|nr:hypothetical protein P3342_009782 [Pyrenophora teres f. teres]